MSNPYDEAMRAWDVFLREYVLVRNHDVRTANEPPVRSPFLDRSLMSLMMIHLALVLDEGLEACVNERGIQRKGATLNDRINAVGDAGLLTTKDALHDFRHRRNAQAHETNVVNIDDFSSPTWESVEEDVVLVHKTFVELGIVGQRPKYEYFFQREAFFPTEGDFAVVHTYMFGVKLDGKEVLKGSDVRKYRHIGH